MACMDGARAAQAHRRSREGGQEAVVEAAAVAEAVARAVEGETGHEGHRARKVDGAHRAGRIGGRLFHAEGAVLKAVEGIDRVPVHRPRTGHHPGQSHGLSRLQGCPDEPARVHLGPEAQVRENGIGRGELRQALDGRRNGPVDGPALSLGQGGPQRPKALPHLVFLRRQFHEAPSSLR